MRFAVITEQERLAMAANMKRSKYTDLYSALLDGKTLRLDFDSAEEMERIRVAMTRWAKRRGLVLSRIVSGRSVAVKILTGAEGQRTPTAAPPAAVAKPKELAEWESRMRPPDPVSIERIVGGRRRGRLSE